MAKKRINAIYKLEVYGTKKDLLSIMHVGQITQRVHLELLKNEMPKDCVWTKEKGVVWTPTHNGQR
jgi:hypothetical protein